jgi:hypothetical protein
MRLYLFFQRSVRGIYPSSGSHTISEPCGVEIKPFYLYYAQAAVIWDSVCVN